MGIAIMHAICALAFGAALVAFILRVRNGWVARRDRALWTRVTRARAEERRDRLFH